jgi:hypothetical protein
LGVGGSREFRSTPQPICSVLAVASDNLLQEAFLLSSSASHDKGDAGHGCLPTTPTINSRHQVVVLLDGAVNQPMPRGSNVRWFAAPRASRLAADEEKAPLQRSGPPRHSVPPPTALTSQSLPPPPPCRPSRPEPPTTAPHAAWHRLERARRPNKNHQLKSREGSDRSSPPRPKSGSGRASIGGDTDCRLLGAQHAVHAQPPNSPAPCSPPVQISSSPVSTSSPSTASPPISSLRHLL